MFGHRALQINSSTSGVEEICFVPKEFHLNVNFLSDSTGKVLLHYGYYSKYYRCGLSESLESIKKGSVIDG